jgi:Porin PorA
MRKWGVAVAVLGVLMLAGAALLRYVVVPGGQELPADTSEKITYVGELTSLNQAALESGDTENATSTVPVRVARHVQVLQAEGDKARVSDAAVVTDTESGRTLSDTENFYTVDRKTLVSVPNFTDEPAEKAEGLVIGYPIGTEKYNYVGWLQEVRDTGHSLYSGEEEVKGLSVYKFTGTYSAPLPEDQLPPGGATSVPKADLVGLTTAMGLPADLQKQLKAALPALPDEIPLTYTYGQNDRYLVEPTTGVIVDMTRTTRISTGMVGLGDMQLPVYTLTVRYTPDNVTDMVNKAQDSLDQLRLYGTTIPLVLLVAGIVCLAVALPMMLHRRKGGEVAPPAPRPRAMVG